MTDENKNENTTVDDKKTDAANVADATDTEKLKSIIDAEKLKSTMDAEKLKLALDAEKLKVESDKKTEANNNVALEKRIRELSDELEKNKKTEAKKENDDYHGRILEQQKMIDLMSEKMEKMERKEFIDNVSVTMDESTTEKFLKSIDGISLGAAKEFYERVKSFIPEKEKHNDYTRVSNFGTSDTSQKESTREEVDNVRRGMFSGK